MALLDRDMCEPFEFKYKLTKQQMRNEFQISNYTYGSPFSKLTGSIAGIN